ncbi:hypothetical protein EDC01DRAFT_327943 [Geopyxis carbonaria]|nr:hypothetical protein EDC01DRAFT_327943 [Geopyxis carbonaria]
MPPTAVAKVNGTVIAESDIYLKIEDNIYFPPTAVHKEYLQQSQTRTHCPWKGDASYYDVVVNDVKIVDGAWYYARPKDKFSDYKDYIAFYKNKPDLTIGTIPE